MGTLILRNLYDKLYLLNLLNSFVQFKYIIHCIHLYTLIVNIIHCIHLYTLIVNIILFDIDNKIQLEVY